MSAKGTAYCWRPFVSFDDTNLVGNVYFARFVGWQGNCREAFLAQHAPEVLDALTRDFRLVTLRVSCEFFEELRAFDPVEIEMRLIERNGHRLSLRFDYRLERDSQSALAAQGMQDLACMRQTSSGLVPTELPASLARALLLF